MFSIAWLFFINWISCLIPCPSASKHEKLLSWQENPLFQRDQMGFLSSPVLFCVLTTSQRSLDSRTTRRATLNFKLSRLFSKIEIPERCIVHFFTTKVGTLISAEEGWAISRSLNDKISNIRHYEILAKTRSRLTTATTFSRQNDVGSRACTTQYWESHSKGQSCAAGFFFQLTWILNCIKLISWGGLNVQGVALFVCECIKNIQCHSNKTSVWFILYLVVIAYRSMWFWLAHSKQHVNNWSKGDRVKIVFSCYISRCMSCRLPRNHCACLK